MDKFINDKVNELEVKDNFDSINKDVDYSKYVKVKTPFYKRKVYQGLIGGLTLAFCAVLVIILSLGDIKEPGGNLSENAPQAPSMGEPGIFEPEEEAPSMDSSKPNDEYNEVIYKITTLKTSLIEMYPNLENGIEEIALKWINKINNAEPTEDISRYFILFEEEVNDYISQNRGE